VGYLKPDQRAASLIGYKKMNYWNLGELKAYIESRYEIVFSSQQSYYEIFDAAGLSWKKSQKRNPKTAPELVKKNKELTQWLEAHRNEIELGELVVFFQDECHLLWGDICGYVWGKKNERVEVQL
jgi:putative transposase